ncbi:hypothetical protein [Faucicola boevrei]|uniref:hypothetical protein n=1 Tax=Faucicola boevrei TaxID=346665 RepID=UPI0003798F00|nr:hypothetical protein [Moraxella boevrei]
MSILLDIASAIISGGLVSCTIYAMQQAYTKKQRAIDVQNQLQSIDFYRQIYVPVWGIYVKWQYLPESKKTEYRTAVVDAWVNYDNQPGTQHIYEHDPDFKIEENMRELHFSKDIKREKLTEHESLSLFLTYWTGVWQQIDRKLIDKKDVGLFYESYHYFEKFMESFRQAVLNANQDSNPELPAWYDATIKLEKAFKQNLS